MVCGCRPYRQNEPWQAPREGARSPDHPGPRAAPCHRRPDAMANPRAPAREPGEHPGAGAGARAAKGTIGHHVRVLETRGSDPAGRDDASPRRHREALLRVARQFRLPARRRRSGRRPDGDWPQLPIRAALAEARRAAATTDPSTSFVVRARMPAARAKRFAELIEADCRRVRRRRAGRRGDVRLRRGDLRARLGEREREAAE